MRWVLHKCDDQVQKRDNAVCYYKEGISNISAVDQQPLINALWGYVAWRTNYCIKSYYRELLGYELL